MKYLKHLIILLAIASITFFVSNVLINGSLNHKLNLGGELKSSADSLYQWKISQEAPFKYRVLHRAIVVGVYQILSNNRHDNELFFNTYRIMAFIFHYLAICLFYYFLSQTKLKIYALAGAIIFALLPAMSLAYNVPVHTREDTLAYSILLLGLVAIMKNNIQLILIFFVLGVFCRETLLLLPFVNLFFNQQQKLVIRIAIAGLCFALFFGIRFYIEPTDYNHWEGFNWNRTHLLQVIGFAYVSFGILWMPFLLHIIDFKKNKIDSDILHNSSLSVFLLVMITTFLGGIFNEIRIIYLLAPWVIYTGILYYKGNKTLIQEYVGSKLFVCLAILAFVVIAGTSLEIVRNLNNYIMRSEFDIPYTSWIAVVGTQIYFGILCLPYFFKLNSERQA